jgi:hypothetical protein
VFFHERNEWKDCGRVYRCNEKTHSKYEYTSISQFNFYAFFIILNCTALFVILNKKAIAVFSPRQPVLGSITKTGPPEIGS